MGDMAMYREHLIRAIRELESDREEEPDESSASCLGDLELAGNECGIKRNATRVETKTPSIKKEERGEIRNYAPTQLITWPKWLDLKPCMEWAYLDRSIEAQRTGALECTASSMDTNISGMKEPVEIPAIERLPIGEERATPHPRIEKQDEKKENNEDLGRIPENKAAVSNPPPQALPIRESTGYTGKS